MLGRVRGLWRCLHGRHERNAEKAVHDGRHYVSNCMHCGVRMRRRAKRDWIVERR